ncbi:MAG: penicillin-binding protein 2 [Myxococcaceae bacterium]|nr:MAG: penicillin-binding protein 2 [Myxococcaceae bacterium]
MASIELVQKAGLGEIRERVRFMSAAVLLGVLLLVGRVFWIQIVDNARWLQIAEDNVLRRVDLPSTRGMIRDSRGRVIAANRPAYNVYVIPGYFPMDRFTRFADYLGLTRDERDRLEARMRNAEGSRRYQHMLARSDIDRESLALIETHRSEFPRGISVIATPVRQYPFGELAAHALGFLNEVNADDLREFAGRDYRAGERMGRSGVEQAWESILRGRRGWVRLEHDVRGLLITRDSIAGLGPDRHRDPVPGRDLVLTLDMELMRAIDRAFRGKPSGAAAVVEVRTGRVLALYSKPSVDPNTMTMGISALLNREIDENPYRPRIDKTIYESYYPGSTFKPFTALAGLEAGLIDARSQVTCTGRHELGRRVFRCKHVHGPVSLHRALVESCNVYFYTLAEAVTMDRIASMAFDFGLGHRSGIGINQETPGFIPTRAWYAQNYPGQFRIGHTLNTAIGQGNVRVTVLQLAMAYAALANGGTLFVPQLVSRVEGPDGTIIQTFPPTVRRQVSVTPAHLSMITNALAGVISDAHGTAHAAQIAEVDVAGKTGTAQVSRIVRDPTDPRRSWSTQRDHAWFAGFAPAASPEIAVVLLVEHGGSGGHEAAPLMTQVVREYFTRIRPGAPIPSVATWRAHQPRR